MLELKKGVDILTDIGGVKDAEEVKRVFRDSMDDDNFAKIEKITNSEARLKIANAIALGKPSKVLVNDGSDADVLMVRKLVVEYGEEKDLNIPDHTIHYDLAEEQARIVDRTFYIANPDEKVSSLANRIDRDDAYNYVKDYMAGMMDGMTLVIGFYSRGPVGAVAAIPAIEMTTSLYVCHSAELLYRNCFDQFDAEVDRAGLFFTNVHSQGPNRAEDLPNARVFMDRSHQTTYSTFCTYAGNTLLLKKGNHRFAVDRATYYRKGLELSEHMFITGLEGPGGRVTFFAGAAPSGCGKTTTAMVGEEFISDDLAQIWISEDGTIRSINPESGIFGIIEDVNWTDDPMIMDILRKQGHEVIFSNVLIVDGVPYWVGSGEENPDKGFNFQGEWFEGKTDANGKAVPLSHGNARFTIRASSLSNYSDKMQDPAGVVTKVFTYNGRDADTMPPVRVARNADEGVVIGASIVSKATATEVGVTGVKRQPWANQPFIPGALGDNMVAQFEFFNSDKISAENRPIMAGLNYFLTHEARGGEGSALLGEKRDVKVWLGWLERLVNNEVETIYSPVGLMPTYEDLKNMFKDLLDKDYSRELYDKQFSLYIDKIMARIDLQYDAFKKEENIPDKLYAIYDEQKVELEDLRSKYGDIVNPDQVKEWADAK
ncbi:MAG: phosphoenolpyruvate carboxykinase (GTP) [Desulfarculaceae bacterium]|nr:phosphoenolpyruvate carboxykinase (GTP) [Desulfarculaceae bacterium]MCF8073476.1 phosphoenolpyruvate carboxykinase (GTP) [Desulfarculaceae bacterium]MCF8100377.1 phosphoenolpyruvate carboxykinase (GTP) [Desulfarculaceae bacterium]MCF8115887.1 phosphoenolpyruvate carboxykinase (GTP) [Desulfarculaceae bacterium]